MTARSFRLLGLLALVLSVGACGGGGSKAPPKTTVRVVNAVPDRGTLTFRREQDARSDSNLPFATSSPEFQYDQDTYDFNVYATDPQTQQAALALTFPQEVVAGTLYTFVLVERGGEPGEVTLEAPSVEPGATDAQVQALHALESLGPVDVYLEPPGPSVAVGTPWGTIGFDQTLPATKVTAGQYQLTVTVAGDPTQVLTTTGTFTLDAATSTAFVLAPETGEHIVPLTVLFAQATTTPLIDRNAQSALRAINGADDRAPRDVALNGQFTPPVFSAVPFASVTASVPLAAASEVPLNVTPAGNPGVLELDTKVSLLSGRSHTLVFWGEAGSLGVGFATDDRQRVKNVAKITLYDVASQIAALEPVFTTPGTDPATVAGATVLAPGNVSAALSAPAGDYEIYLRDPITKALLAGPVPVTLEPEGLYGVIITNGATATALDLTLIDDFL